MNTHIAFPNAYRATISLMALLAMSSLSGCWEKQPTKEEIAAQIKSAVAEAKQEAAAQSAAAATPVATPKPATKSVAKAKPKTTQEAPVQKIICTNCGVVVSVKMLELEGKGSGLGVIAGGVAGGLLGHQIGDGTGKDLATIAGAVGGAIAGNKVEKVMKKTKVYDVTVKMENGEEVTLRHTIEPDLAAGDKVKVENDLAIKQ